MGLGKGDRCLSFLFFTSICTREGGAPISTSPLLGVWFSPRSRDSRDSRPRAARPSRRGVMLLAEPDTWDVDVASSE